MEKKTKLAILAAGGLVAFLLTSKDSMYTSPGATTPQASDKTNQLISKLKSYLGVPYVWGGTEPSPGFDCSGLVEWCYSQIGIAVPRLVTEQAEQAPIRINLKGKSLAEGIRLIRPGYQIGLDYTEGGRYDHVGTYIGLQNGSPRIIAASGGQHTPGEVKNQTLNQWWADNWRTAYSYIV
jgi:cell wall-associated NlpC family hydrolase